MDGKICSYSLLVGHTISSNGDSSHTPFSSHVHKHYRHGTNNTSSVLSRTFSVWHRRELKQCSEKGRKAQSLSVIPEAPMALVMGGRNVMTGHFKGDSVQGHVTLSLTTL